MPTRHSLSLAASSGGATPFDPRSIPNLDWWLDASDASTAYDTPGMANRLTTTAPLGRLLDKSGNGYDISQGNSANQGTWTTNKQGGLPGLILSSSSLYVLSAGHSSPGTALTVLVVATVAASAQIQTLLSGTTGGLDLRWDTGYHFDSLQENQVDAGAALSPSPNAAASLNVFQMDSGGHVSYRLNGQPNSSGSNTLSIGGTTYQMFQYSATGSSSGQAGGNAMKNCTFYELLFYKRQLSAAELGILERYLNFKYQLGF